MNGLFQQPARARSRVPFIILSSRCDPPREDGRVPQGLPVTFALHEEDEVIERARSLPRASFMVLLWPIPFSFRSHVVDI
jgi:hypothetical protein